MSAVTVFCPHCGKGLKLRDRSKLGRKASCPSCSKMFVLAEPKPEEPVEEEEVELQLAPQGPAVGTGAKWVPDTPPAPPATPASPFPSFESPAPVGGAPVGDVPEGFPAVAVPSENPFPAIGGGGAIAADDGLAKLRERKQQAAKRRNRMIAGVAVIALLFWGGVWGVMKFGGEGEATSVATSAGGTATASGEAPDSVLMPSVVATTSTESILLPHHALTQFQMRDNEQLVSQVAPVRGNPIRLVMAPSGVNVLIHLRPALLWSEDPVWQEVRYSLTEDLTNWLAERLKAICRRDPQQIEECLIGLRLGATGTEPDVASVVYLVTEEKRSDLLEEFRGQALSEMGGPRVNVAPPFAYLIRDTRSFAIAPSSDADELSQFVENPNPNSSEGIYQLLKNTDNQRVMTVIFDVDDVKRHNEWLFSESVRPTIDRVLDWFGNDVESVCWSVDVHEGSLTSDLFLRTRSTVNSTRAAGEIMTRFESLPKELVAACRKMSPPTQGFQAIIGRFPAMIEAYRQATIPTLEPRHLRLTTVLPQKAAPNLALGTLLTWDQSLLTNFSEEAPVPAMVASAQSSALPESVIDRLKLTMMDTNITMPFQDAVAYVANECKVNVQIDGNALKDAGFTLNMPQQLNLGRVSGFDVLKHIITANKPGTPEKRLCVVIDEETKTFLMSTEFFAKEQGQTFSPIVTP